MIILCTLWCIPPTLNPEGDIRYYVFLADKTTRLYIYLCIVLQKYIIDDNSSPVTITNKYVISFLILFFQIIITIFFFTEFFLIWFKIINVIHIAKVFEDFIAY